MRTNLPNNLAFGHTFYRQLQDLEFEPCVDDKNEVETSSSTDELLNSIFAVDPVTMLPRGDVQVYMSDKVSPEIREFIRQNLMSPVKTSADISAKFGTLSDDEIAFFSRNSQESLGDYRQRLFDYISETMKSRNTSVDE